MLKLVHNTKAFVLHCLLWVFAQFTEKQKIALCCRLALLAPKLFPRRYRIIETNLKRCFPHLTESELKQLIKSNVRETLIGYLLTLTYWYRPIDDLKERCRVENLDIIRRYQKQGVGIILLGGHFTTLDIAGIATAFHIPFAITYRPNNSQLVDGIINRGRRIWSDKLINAKNVAAMMRVLRNGEILWYAPDQDFGCKGSVFSDFFSIPTATTKGIGRLSRLGRAVVVPVNFYRDKNNGNFIVQMNEPLEDSENNDSILVDQYNRFLQQKIEMYPEQYLWAHRRFKTRPVGDEPFY